jgi:nucleoid-associated protein EbfC
MDMNPFELLKNAKAMQEQFAKMQAELVDVSVTGSSGGGIVKVTMNGQFELLGVALDPVSVDSRDIPMLQDLLVAAHADACEKIKELLKTKVGPLAGSFGGL